MARRKPLVNRFYLASFRDNVGANIAFHANTSSGYVTDLDNARVMTLEEAQAEWGGLRHFEQPISADHLDALAVWKVDCQHIPYDSVWLDKDTLYYLFRRGSYDGNDVFWRTADGHLSLDVTQAKPFNREDALALHTHYVAVPMAQVQAKKRRTVDMAHFNPRIMVQGAGLVQPERVKQQRRRSRYIAKRDARA